MNRYQRIAFFSLLATLPIQLGKHFWPLFSFVQGIRIDYLSPTFYLSDLCFIFLFLVSFRSLKFKLSKIFFSKHGVLLVFSMFCSTILAANLYAAIFGVVKLSEFIYIGVFVSHFFKKRDIESSLFILALGGLVESVIILFQFVAQHSLGGMFYYLGERTFNASTPGIATAQFMGNYLLRPYGTFPHPNVAAFFLLFVFVWVLYSLKLQKTFISFLKILVLVILSIGIVLTLSRIITFLLIGIILYKIRPSGRINITLTLLGVLGICILLFQRFEATLIKDLVLREELVEIAVKIFFANPVFGTGLNNFFYTEILFQKTLSPILLQPVHNIYLYWITQTGIVGFVIAVSFIKKIAIELKKKIELKSKENFYKFVAITIFCIGFTGMFDHYFLTLQQGQLLTTIIIGFCFSNIDS